MGQVCGSLNLTPEEKERAKKSGQLDSLLKKRNNEVKEEVKLLLLGPGESGKSTIFKQMKIISMGGGFTDHEQKAFRFIIYGNCITQMKVLVGAVEKLGLSYDSADNDNWASQLIELPATGDAWSRQIGEAIMALWNDAAIQQAYEQRDKQFQLNDSASYFFQNVDRFLNDDYVPTEQDILRARVRSTGIDEAEFDFEDFSFRMLDVGGQRSERRKWIHCFDCVTAVLFCASLSEYDQKLREDDSQNRMKESLLLFDEICNSPWFRDTSFILFLNKTDLFREKIQRIPITSCFPQYNGPQTFEASSDYIKGQFMEQSTGNHQIYTHLTCAISTENVKFVFKCVKDTIINSILSQLSLY